MNKNKTREIAKQLNIIDDTLFQKMAEDIGFCEELISTVLSEKVEVLKVIKQDSLKNLQGRSVILDAWCKLQDGRIVCVEVEKSRKHNHFKRTRYNTSCITTNITSPGIDFENVPDLIAIYISNFDIFQKGKLIYHVERIVKETGDICDNGVQEIYVNAKADDGSDLAELMKIFREQDKYNYEKFPRVSKRKHQFIESERGGKEMCELVENYAKEYAVEYALEKAKEAAKEFFVNGADFEMVLKSFKDISEEELRIIYNEVKGGK